jgi:hypothetical protein
MKVHPIAQLFAMLSEEALTDLVADIKTQGLLNPIVLDEEGMLIDGRNRLRACELAGVDPRFERLSGHDPVAFIFGQNVKRRHIGNCQSAMAAAATQPASSRPAKRRGNLAGAKAGSPKR